MSSGKPARLAGRQSAEILARSLFRKLADAGYAPEQVVAVANELLELVSRQLAQRPVARAPGRPLGAHERHRIQAQVDEARDRADHEEAARRILSGYGPEVLAWFFAVFDDDEGARRAHAIFREEVGRTLCRRGSSGGLRAQVYRLAHDVAARLIERREVAGGAREPAPNTPGGPGEATRLRACLDAEDRMILILRVDREMAWEEVARVLGRDEIEIKRRFEWIRSRLRRLAGERDADGHPVAPGALAELHDRPNRRPG